MAITTQPGQYPPALQYLGALDQVVVKQEVSLLEVVLPFEVGNKYSVCNSMGQRVFLASEDSNFCCKQCCGPHRPFVIKICDNAGAPLLHVERPCNCGAFCPYWPCCFDVMTVNAEQGAHFGSIERKCNPCCPGYRIMDASGKQQFNLDGPCCCMLCMAAMCCQDQNFKLTDLEGNEIGTVAKQYSGALKELFTDADVFSATFPQQMDITMKSIILGSVFLIDFNFYEQPAGDKGAAGI